MDISSVKPIGYSLPPTPVVAQEEAAQRQKLVQAAKAVNASGTFGRNQLVFMVDRATHRPIIRVVDPDTHEVLLQLPPEYVLRLAQDLGAGSHTSQSSVDT